MDAGSAYSFSSFALFALVRGPRFVSGMYFVWEGSFSD